MLGDRGRTPHEVLAALTRSSGGMGGMDGMGGTGESMTSTILGGAGDVDYPHYLINGRLAAAPDTFTGKPGQRVRLRLINAGPTPRSGSHSPGTR